MIAAANGQAGVGGKKTSRKKNTGSVFFLGKKHCNLGRGVLFSYENYTGARKLKNFNHGRILTQSFYSMGVTTDTVTVTLNWNALNSVKLLVISNLHTHEKLEQSFFFPGVVLISWVVVIFSWVKESNLPRKIALL